MNPIIETQGDLLAQSCDVIVNPWNRNIIPWWLLVPQGVSGAIKRAGGTMPFRELRGAIPLGEARRTSAGRLPFRAIIHVAGINLMWRATPRSVLDSVQSACKCAIRSGDRSVAFPYIGAGSGGMKEESVRELMIDAFQPFRPALEISLVRFKKKSRPARDGFS